MEPLTTDDLRELVTQVGSMAATHDDADRIERIRQFESLRAAISAAQAAVAVDFDRSQRALRAIAGDPVARQGRGVAEQVALARRVSPWQGRRWLSWAKTVTGELPATLGELRAGRTSEARAMIVVRETEVLSGRERAAVDHHLAPHLSEWGDREVEQRTRATVARVAPEASAERARRAATERHVRLRPAPDGMCRLSALVPAAHGVSATRTLRREADRLRAAGDPRTLAQLMADLLIERLTGQSVACGPPVEISLVLDERTLLRGGNAPGFVDGYGPVPAELARVLAYGRDAVDTTDITRAADVAGQAVRWIRRLYQRHGTLVAMESHRRLFPEGLQRFLRRRDRTCRTPWCDAPIAHADHVEPYARGGRTTTSNGQGLCAACNHARQALYWHSSVQPDGSILTTTPTGHRYSSSPPTITGPPDGRSPLEWHYAHRFRAA